jgi:hypothetical protein
MADSVEQFTMTETTTDVALASNQQLIVTIIFMIMYDMMRCLFYTFHDVQLCTYL